MSANSTAAAARANSSPTAAIPAILQCRICLDPCASPIYNCPNGHLTCGICSDRLQPPKCPLKCAGKLTPSFLGERLSREYDIRVDCQYREDGCSTPIKATKLKEHLESACEYRDILCTRSSKFQSIAFPHNGEFWRCNQFVPLGGYRKHLAQVHNLCPRNNVGNKSLGVSKLFSDNDPASLDYWKGPQNFELVPIEFQGMIFQLHVVIENFNLHYWVTVLGDGEQAGKYAVMIRLLPPQRAQHRYDLSTTLPILPFHGNSTFNQFKGHYGTIAASTLSQFYTDKCVYGGFLFKLSWEIYKVEGQGVRVRADQMAAAEAEPAPGTSKKRKWQISVDGSIVVYSYGYED